MKINSRNMIILFFTLVVVMMGFGMIIPLLPFYVESFGAGGQAVGFLMAIYALMQFLMSPIWGDLSDQYGRKPILLIGILGNAVAQLLFGLSNQLWMLFAARALAGILSSATLPTAMAFIGDSTEKEDRGGGMGTLGAAMGIGMVLGPGLGGWLAEAYNLSLPFFVASGLSTLALILVLVLLPESLPDESRTKMDRLHGPQLGEMWKALFGPLGILLLMAFVVSFGVTKFETVFSLFAQNKFDYGPKRVSTILVFIGITSAIIQGALTGVLTRKLGEVFIIRASLLVSAIGFVAMTQARTYPGVIATTLLFITGNAMLRPSVSALTSRRATTGQGVAMGLNNAFMSLGRIAGPVLAGYLFDQGVNLPYLAGAVIMALGLVIGLIWLQKEIPDSTTEPVMSTQS